MSERGSFTTDYLYCDACFAAACEVLVSDNKYHRGVPIPSWQLFDRETNGRLGAWQDQATGEMRAILPIIAGKFGGSYPHEEIHQFERELGPELAARICHPMRVAVLSDAERSVVFRVAPPDLVETLFSHYPEDPT